MYCLPEHFKIPFEPSANKGSIISGKNVRFTVLTPRLIRIEYSSSNSFEDRASQVFWYRNQPVPDFTYKVSENLIEIETEFLNLTYRCNENMFDKDTLSILLKQSGTLWHYGDNNTGNLLGTARTLDQANGQVKLDQGLMSKYGWSVIDDSKSLVFNEEYMLTSRDECEKDCKDLYFFGYGHDYKQCLKDYCSISGEVPLLPRWALGNWWSRYWDYTQEELTNLMQDFEDKEIPLSVCIIDMDWHLVKNLPTSRGWTGYTWNKDLFPEPEKLIEFLHQKGLKTALNLHPADGVHPHEEMYKEVADFMGIEPSSKKAIEFDITDPKFIEAYFKLLLHPLEKKGIDFWWMDWQQGTQTKKSGLDPLWVLNHLHFLDLGRNIEKRPFIFSRWGGYGNHRYQIGFSGDTDVTWDSLQFQPYFTLTASNVGYSWWSHDIGGHFKGFNDFELYTRWVQFGIFSPIMRLHSSKSRFQERLPWKFNEEVYKITKDALQLRHALIPYIYSMSWKNHSECVPLTQPMYYNHPEEEQAYCCQNQYYFGSELIAAPIITPKDEDTGLPRQVVWLPEGDWFNFFTGEHYCGNQRVALYADLNEIPVFAKAGAIIPLGPKAGRSNVENPSQIEVHIFPGADNTFDLYEDDGVSQNYKKGEYAITTYCLKCGSGKMEFEVMYPEGEVSIIPAKRDYIFKFRSMERPDNMILDINNLPYAAHWSYDDKLQTISVGPVAVTPADKINISLSSSSENMTSTKDCTLEKCEDLLKKINIGTLLKAKIFNSIPEIIKSRSELGYGLYEKNPSYKGVQFTGGLKLSQTIALAEVISKKDIMEGFNGKV